MYLVDNICKSYIQETQVDNICIKCYAHNYLTSDIHKTPPLEVEQSSSYSPHM